MSTRSHADGVIHYAIQFCTPYQMEAHAMERSARDQGLPFLRLETDYSMEDVAPARDAHPGLPRDPALDAERRP